MKKMIAVILLAAMAFGMAACTTEAPLQETIPEQTVEQVQEETAELPVIEETQQVEMESAPDMKTVLTKVSEIKDPENKMRAWQNGFVLQEGEGFTLLSVTGEALTGQPLTDYEYLGDGLYEVTADKEDVNRKGLVAYTGEILIDCDAAGISRVGDRYVSVIYGTGTTDNEEEAYFYTTENSFSITYDKGDVMYKGYSKIYDLEQKRFVSHVEVTNPYRYAVISCGDTFAVKDEEGVTRIYNENGESLVETRDTVEVEGLYCVSGWGKPTKIYDKKGTLVSELELDVSLIRGSEKYLEVWTEDYLHQITDLKGNILSEEKYDIIYEENGGLFEVKTEDGKEQLVCADGTVMAEAGDYGYFGYGCYIVEKQNSELLVDAEGVLFEIAADDERLKNENCVFNFAKRDVVALKQELWESLTDYLTEIREIEMKKHGAYDVLSGEIVLPCEYDEITVAGDHLYAKQGDIWNVFAIEYPAGAAE